MSFGQNFGVDLCWCPVAVFDDVVLVVQVGKLFDQGQFVPEALVDPEGQLAWCQLAGQRPGGECSCGGFLSGNAVRWVEGEAEFVECWEKEIGDVIIRLRACARGQHPQSGTVEAGDERITGASDDIGRTNLAHAPENGSVLKLAGCWFGRRHLSMISSPGRAKRAGFTATPARQPLRKRACRVRVADGGPLAMPETTCPPSSCLFTGEGQSQRTRRTVWHAMEQGSGGVPHTMLLKQPRGSSRPGMLGAHGRQYDVVLSTRRDRSL